MRDASASHDPYAVLGVPSDSDFTAIKKAYYRRVKECHPDLFPGGEAKAKEEEFKDLAAAFDRLSDPDQRRRYDASCGMAPLGAITPEPALASVLDTPGDDILEELIMGNAVPRGTTVATLLLDLQKTEVFITFREGKTLFAAKRYPAAVNFFRKAVTLSPNNILYRIYLARTCVQIGTLAEGNLHYRVAIALGERRTPPQLLLPVRQEWDKLKRHRHPWWQGLIGHFFAKPAPSSAFINPAGEMIDETNRAIAKLLRKDHASASAPPPDPPRQLPK